MYRSCVDIQVNTNACSSFCLVLVRSGKAQHNQLPLGQRRDR
jgi:hypothetical protein